MQKIIKCTVSGEYVRGSGVVAGAAGSHDDVVLELAFKDIWEGTTKTAFWWDANGENPTATILTLAMLVPGETEVYRVPIPAEAKAYEGQMKLTLRGVVLSESGIIEEQATVSADAYFEILAGSVPDEYKETMQVTPSVAEQIQAGVDALKGEFLEAQEAERNAIDAADRAKQSEENAAISESNALSAVKAAAESEQSALEAADRAESYSINPPYPDNEVWYIWDGTKYVATNEPSRGEKGDKGDQGIQGVKGDKGDRGEKGDKGDRGEQGMQGIQGVKGEKGDTGAAGKNGTNGKDGADGYTPVRGVDYWTEEDKEEIIAEVQEDLQNTDNWEVIEKICFGYELLTEKPDDWDENKTTKYYYAATENSCKMYNCHSWDTWMLNRYWRYTGEYDTQIQKIERSKEPDGTPYNFKCVAAFGHLYNTVKAGLWCFNAYLSEYDFQNQMRSINGVIKYDTQGSGYPYHMAYKVEQSYGVYDLTGWYGNQGNFTARTGAFNASPDSLMRPITDGNIKGISFHIYSAKEYYSEGDYIEIWGVRADG